MVLANIFQYLGESQVPEWTIEKCSSDDSEGVYDLLKRSFFKDEPLTCDMTSHPPMEELFAIKMLGQGHSYKAVLPSGRIVGVVININFAELPEDDDGEKPTAGRISQIFKFFDFIEARTKDLTKGLLEVHVIATDGTFRRQGMAKALIDVTEELAGNNRLRGVKMACTSAFSARLASSLGYKEVFSIAYSDYTDENCHPVFSPPQIHTHMRLYIKEL